MEFSAEAWKIGLLGSRRRPVIPTGCPTPSQQIEPIDFFPQPGAHECEKPRESPVPRRVERLESQQQATRKRAPNLPAHRVGLWPRKSERVFRLLRWPKNTPCSSSSKKRGKLMSARSRTMICAERRAAQTARAGLESECRTLSMRMNRGGKHWMSSNGGGHLAAPVESSLRGVTRR